jgi:hypothetical protein
MQQTRIGTVVNVQKQRSYFFISYEARQIFCHVSHWSELELPALGDRVSFEIGPARKPEYPFQAVNVRPAEAIVAGIDALLAAQIATNPVEAGKDGVA